MGGVQRGGQLGEGAGEVRVKVPGVVWEGAAVRTQQAGGLGIASGTWGARGGSGRAQLQWGGRPLPAPSTRFCPFSPPRGICPLSTLTWFSPVLPWSSQSFGALKALLPACPLPSFPPPCLSPHPPGAFKHTQAQAQPRPRPPSCVLPLPIFARPLPSDTGRVSPTPSRHPHPQALTGAQERERAVQTQLVCLRGEQGRPGPRLSQARG